MSSITGIQPKSDPSKATPRAVLRSCRTISSGVTLSKSSDIAALATKGASPIRGWTQPA